MSPFDAARAAELLGRAAAVRVLVVGDLMLDRYVSGRVERVSPEAPVPVVLVDEEHCAIGGAGNVAANVTALGAGCAVVGCVGDDAEGADVLAALRQKAVDSAGVARDPTRPTTVKTRVHSRTQQIVRFDREVDRAVGGDLERALAESVRASAAACDAIVIQDYDKGVLTPIVVAAALESAEKRGVPAVVDPKRRAFFGYAGATVFKPNLRELEDAFGGVAEPDDEGWMERARARLKCRHLLVTLGDRGAALQTDDSRLTRLPAATREVYDVSGAGDTVSATVAVALAAGATPLEAAILANHAAAVEVQRPGVRTVPPAEIVAQVESWPD